MMPTTILFEGELRAVAQPVIRFGKARAAAPLETRKRRRLSAVPTLVLVITAKRRFSGAGYSGKVVNGAFPLQINDCLLSGDKAFFTYGHDCFSRVGPVAKVGGQTG